MAVARLGRVVVLGSLDANDTNPEPKTSMVSPDIGT